MKSTELNISVHRQYGMSIFYTRGLCSCFVPHLQKRIGEEDIGNKGERQKNSMTLISFIVHSYLYIASRTG